MITGWDKGFIIEYEKKEQKNFSCRLCERYFSEDKSCSKGHYLPEVGYDMWKNCSGLKYTYFDASQDKIIKQLERYGRLKCVRGMDCSHYFAQYGPYEYKSRVYSGYRALDKEKKELFGKAWEGDLEYKARIKFYIPSDMWDNFKLVLSRNKIREFTMTVFVFYRILGIEPGAKDLRRIVRRFTNAYKLKMNSLKETPNQDSMEESFIDFILEYMKKNRAF